jgi:thiamine-monophosphate kinase
MRRFEPVQTSYNVFGEERGDHAQHDKDFSETMASTSRDEFAFIEWLRQRTPADRRVLIGPGDDAAALGLTPGVLSLVTTDMLLDGSCFVLAEAGGRQVGRKALAVNLSDIAAMAGKPVAAFVSLGLPRHGGRALAEEL